MQPQDGSADQVIARIAGRSHGIATHRELLEAGLGRQQIKTRVARGSLITEHRGVYRVGHGAPSTKARYMAAVRAAGDGACISGQAAAYLHRLIRRDAPSPEVTTTAHRRIPGLPVHRVRNLDARDVTTHDRIPVTTVARTIVDLAAVLQPWELGRVVHEARVIHRTTPRQVEATLARRPNSPGATVLRRILFGDFRITLSRLERRFLQRLRQAGLELPETNRREGRRYVDCRWPKRRLTVELDSYRFHGSRHAWEQDRRREREAYARGDQFRRYTWHDVNDEPAPMLAELHPLLSDPRR